jgi:hypothetical protein
MEIAPRAELMRSLGQLVRGLSALFWGLPITLVVAVWVATNEWTRPIHMLAPIASTGLLFYGLVLIGSFQHQERVWRLAVDRAKIMALVNTGLSPFLYWFNRDSNVPHFSAVVFLLMITGIVFLFNLNHVLQRLAAMLPDETLRSETRVFSNLNLSLLSSILLLFVFLFALRYFDTLPNLILNLVRIIDAAKHLLLVFLLLLPLAMTMTLIWKIKEVVFASVFSHDH